MTDDRILSGERAPDDFAETSLRPQSLEDFTGQQDDFETFGYFMEIHTTDLLQLGHLGQVKIVRVKPGVQISRQTHQFGIHLFLIRKIALVDFDLRA